jgi:hypothetical protein
MSSNDRKPHQLFVNGMIEDKPNEYIPIDNFIWTEVGTENNSGAPSVVLDGFAGGWNVADGMVVDDEFIGTAEAFKKLSDALIHMGEILKAKGY